MAARLKGMGQRKYWRDGDPQTSGPGFGVVAHLSALEVPFRWRKPKRIFVNSMGDLFHESVPETFIGSVFNTMALTPQHTYQILTKRHARMRSLMCKWEAAGWMWRRDDMVWCGPVKGPLPNVWLGVSAEDQKWADIRVPALLDTPASVRFVSAEPLLGPVNLSPWLPRPFSPPEWAESGEPGPEDYPPMLDWVIAGGESGPGARRCEMAWLALLAGQCAASGTGFFCKQAGSVLGREWGAGSHGADWDAWPPELRIRQFPGTRQGAAA